MELPQAKKDKLLQYISKLIDRNIQRRRESGFTQWALIGAFIFIFYNVFDLLSKFTNELDHLDFVSIIYTIFTDGILVSLLLIIIILNTNQSSPSTRLYPKLTNDAHRLINIGLYSFFLVIAFLNVNSIVCSGNIGLEIDPYAFWIISASILLSLLSIFSRYALSKIRNFKKGFHLPQISRFTYIPRRYRLASVILLFIVTAPSLVSIMMWLNHPFSLPTIVNILKLSIYTFCGIVLFIVSITIFFDSNKNYWLTSLESDIYLKNINEDEIVNRLETEYIGLDLSKWCKSRNVYLTEQFKILIEQVVQSRIEFDTIKKMDLALVNEVELKIELLTSDLKTNSYQSRLLVEESAEQVASIIRETSINEKERLEVSKFISTINNSLDKYIKDIESLTNEIESFIDTIST